LSKKELLWVSVGNLHFQHFYMHQGTINFPSGGGGTSSIVVNTKLARTHGEKALAMKDY